MLVPAVLALQAGAVGGAATRAVRVTLRVRVRLRQLGGPQAAVRIQVQDASGLESEPESGSATGT